MPGTRAVEVNEQNFCKPSQNSQRPEHTEMQYNKIQDLIKSQENFCVPRHKRKNNICFSGSAKA